MRDIGQTTITLIDVPYVIPASISYTSFSFYTGSMAAAMEFSPLTDAGGTSITRINSHIMGREALSTSQLAPESLGTPTGTGMQIGDYDTFRLSYGGGIYAVVARHPSAPGTYTALPQRFFLGNNGIDFDPLPPSAVATAPLTGDTRLGAAVPGYVFAPVAAVSICGVSVWNGSGFTKTVNAFQVAGLNIAQLWSGSNFRQMPYLGRNYCFMSDNLFHDPIHFSYSLTDGLVVSPQESVVFPDASIQAAFATGVYEVYCYRKGFLFVIDTNGTGPNGTPFEIVAVSPDFATCSVIKLLPGSPTAETALSRVAGTLWTAKVDTAGNLFWNSGHAADVSSVWVSGIGPSAVQKGSIPIALPCFITCDVNYPQA